MKGTHSNLSQGSWRAALLVLPAACTSVLMFGVVVPPRDAGSAMLDEQRALEHRSTQYEAQYAQSEAYGAAGGLVRLNALDGALDAVLGPPRTALELWSITRLCFERSGFATRSLRFQELESAGLPELGDRVLVQRAQIEGSAPLDALVEGIDLLRDVGLIVSVDELHLDRAAGKDGFETALKLSYWSRVPLSSPLAAATAPQAAEALPGAEDAPSPR